MTEETTTAATRQRRKRKWDQPAEAVSAGLLPGLLPFASMGALQGFPALLGAFPNLATPIALPVVAQHSSSSAVQQNAAAAVVQKFNQELVNRGLMPQAKIQDELIAREITINDAEPGVRYKLTKRQTQEEIQVKTGAVVITRGRYRPPGGLVEPEKPLYLHISAGVHLKDTTERIRAVDQAAAMVEEMLKQGRQTPASSAAGPTGTISTGTVPAPFTVCIYVGFEPDPSYNLLGRIRGPNDQYINHIMNETGATVNLRGRGSGTREAPSGEELPQPLHLYITSDNAKSLEDAKVLAENLLQTVRPPAYPAMPPNSTLVLAHTPATYAAPHPSPYQPSGYSATGVPLVPFPGYHLPANGSYPPAYGGSQPLYYPPGSAVGVTPPVCHSLAAPVTATDLYANRALSSKPYTAVPPPVQLLEQSGVTTSGASLSSPAEDGDQKASTESSSVDSKSSLSPGTPSTMATTSQVTLYAGFQTGSTSSTDPVQPSQEVFRPPNQPIIATPAYQPVLTTQFISPASGRAIPFTHGPSQASSFSGYSGVYPQASPLQQVAQVLQRPPPPMSLKPGSTSAYPAAAPTKAQASFTQDKHSDKQHTQRRRFQEFPVSAVKEASGDEQQVRRGVRSSIVSDLKASPVRDVPSSKYMLRPPAKIMPPLPSPKAHAPISVSPPTEASDSSKNILSSTTDSDNQADDGHVYPHRTDLKLVEYGEEEEESSEHAELPLSSRGRTLQSFTNGKPFWAA